MKSFLITNDLQWYSSNIDLQKIIRRDQDNLKMIKIIFRLVSFVILIYEYLGKVSEEFKRFYWLRSSTYIVSSVWIVKSKDNQK